MQKLTVWTQFYQSTTPIFKVAYLVSLKIYMRVLDLGLFSVTDNCVCVNPWQAWISSLSHVLFTNTNVVIITSILRRYRSVKILTYMGLPGGWIFLNDCICEIQGIYNCLCLSLSGKLFTFPDDIMKGPKECTRWRPFLRVNILRFLEEYIITILWEGGFASPILYRYPLFVMCLVCL